jgi:Rrf2 family transcriptional repressor of oqxAB
MIDVRFPTALQMVLSLAVAERKGERCTSAALASGIGANAVLVRKLAVPLAAEGIVISLMGKNGGLKLGRRPEAITLKDIYQSVTDEKSLFAGRSDVPSVCVVSRNITSFFREVSSSVDEAMLDRLAAVTVADSLERIEALDEQRPGP